MPQHARPPVEWFGKIAAYHLRPSQKRFETPILFIHGAGGGKYQFEHWMQFCSEQGWESYAVDLRGHHESVCENFGSVSIKDYADDVERVIQQIGPCHLVAHSMGGLVAQLVASRNEFVKKAVFMASDPPAGISQINAFAIKTLAYIPSMLVRGTLTFSRKDVLRFLFSHADTQNYESLVPESKRAVFDVALQRIRIKNIQCPTLVVAPKLDKAIPLSTQQKIAHKYHSELIEIPDAGHMLMLGADWKRPIEKILEWLAR